MREFSNKFMEELLQDVNPLAWGVTRRNQIMFLQKGRGNWGCHGLL